MIPNRETKGTNSRKTNNLLNTFSIASESFKNRDDFLVIYKLAFKQDDNLKLNYFKKKVSK